MEGFSQDFRYAVRQMFRQRASSLTAVLTLALGIGVSSALFSVIDATMVRPLPYPNPERLVGILSEETQRDGKPFRPTPSMADMRVWQTADDVFSHMTGSGSAFRGRIIDGPEPERIRVGHFTEQYLSMYGVTPVLGRDFTRADCEFGSPLVALLGYGYWQSRFGGRREAIGESIRLDGDTATIVGVLPAWFNATFPVSIPLKVNPNFFGRRGMGTPTVIGRLRPGVSLAQASERLTAVMGSGATRPVRAIVTSELESAIGRNETTIGVLSAAVVLIVLLACVNVAGLIFARGFARETELRVRASIGAGRGRLIRQLLTESLVLALVGGVLGIFFAWLSLDAIVANIPLKLPDNSPITVNPAVLATTAALLVPITLLSGMWPAVRLSRVRVESIVAKGGGQVGSSLSRIAGQVLIAAEVALAVVLVAGAGLMIRSFVRISTVDIGFQSDHLVTLQVLPLDRAQHAREDYYRALLQRVRALAGVSSAGLVDNFVLGGGTSYTELSVDGKSTFSSVFDMMPGYLETIGASLRGGRLLSDADYVSRFRGVVINESAARAMFGDGQAIGRSFTSGRSALAWTVVGVIADLGHGGPLNDRGVGFPQVFFPSQPEKLVGINPMTVVIRASHLGHDLSEQLRGAAQSIGARVLVEGIHSSNELFTEQVITPRRRTVLLTLLGGLGLLLALVGVAGMTAYAVTRRTAEIGVRIAFGARPGQIVRTMLRDSVIPIAIGTAVGIGAALGAGRVIQSFLFNTSPTDPATLVAVAATLIGSGCLAALVPALRAASVDPVSTLRAE